MAAIGATNCDMVKGEAPNLKQAVDVWRFPGHSGYGAQLLGLDDAAFVFRAILFDTYALVGDWADDLYDLQGTVVSIVNDQGNTFTNCLIQSVSAVNFTTAKIPGSNSDTRGEAEIRGVKTS